MYCIGRLERGVFLFDKNVVYVILRC